LKNWVRVARIGLGKITRGTLGGGFLVGLAFASGAASQTTKVPSTLRHGSGLMDIPVAGVLANRALTVTYSGFWTSNDTDVTTDNSGSITGSEVFLGSWNDDLAAAVGLFDLFELGANLQSFGDAEEGGTLWGAFGRFSILSPQTQPLGLAIGGRYSSSPDFADGIAYGPNRLGRADRRLRGQLGSRSIDTGFSLYAVAGWDLPGFSSAFLPEHDFSFTAGWGNGLFKEGGGLDWYSSGDSGGWFAGVAWNLELAENRLVTFMTEYNAFDWNVGSQVDLNGVRLGAHVLGVNHSAPATVYRSAKFGLIASVALCGGSLCRASLRDRPAPDVVVLPAAPPDTVVVTRVEEPPQPVGTAATLCLATGSQVEVLLTPAGDTLVGRSRTALSELGPAVVLAGVYAENQSWFAAGEPIVFEGRSYVTLGLPAGLNCPDIERVGEYLGVPLFATSAGGTPPETLYVPARPGLWQSYSGAAR
jgi:hypothetical protein